MFEVHVVGRRQMSDGIVHLDLASCSDQPLPRFTAGSHIDLSLGNGLTRQYSLCGDPAADAPYRIAVLREPQSRGGSSFVHSDLTEGARLTISAPRNLFELDETLDAYVLMAGGIGVTPIVAMAHRLHALGKPFTLHYCARSRDDAAFLEELSTAPFASSVRLHHDDDASTALDLDAAFGGDGAARGLYVCGPAGFMDFAFDAALARGWTSSQLHREDFAARPVDTEGDQPFTLVIRATGEEIVVPVGVTAARAIEDAGHFISLSCEQGICGTCLTPVLDGVPDHRDAFQTDEERARNDQFTPCCSRARSPVLVIDI